MKKRVLIFILGVLVLSFVSAVEELEWERTFGGGQLDAGAISVYQTSDGKYVIIGSIGEDVWLIKTDSNGNEIWNKTLKGGYRFNVKAGQQTSDGGNIIIGDRWFDPQMHGNIIDLIKTNSNGDTEWRKNFSEYRVEYYGNDVMQTTDGGYIITGQFQDMLLLIKTDPEGDEEWRKMHCPYRWCGTRDFSGHYGEGKSIQQTQDGGYIILGEYETWWIDNEYRLHQRQYIWLIKTYSSGEIEWSKKFSETTPTESIKRDVWEFLLYGSDVQQTSDGGYIVIGWVGGWGYPFLLLIKTNSSGYEEWPREFYWAGLGKSVQQTIDGGYVIAGQYTWYYHRSINDFFLTKINSEGNMEWRKIFGGDEWNIANSVQQTPDGGYIIAGTSYFNNSYYAHLLKLPSDTESKPPIISNLPDKKISQDTKPEGRWIDLWQYVSDEDTPKSKLNFSITSQTNPSLISCWIEGKRYVTCSMPAKGKSGFSDVTVKVKDPQGLSSIDIFRVEVISPTLAILIIPFDWSGSYENYLEKADELASYFLQRIPLADCSNQFKFLRVEKSEDYGKYWDGWRCDISGVNHSSREHCFYELKNVSALNRTYECGLEYQKSKNEKFDFVVGISDNDIGVTENPKAVKCAFQGSVYGWSDGKGGSRAVIAEITVPGVVTHELGHEFGLSDQYCNCDGTKSEEHCGTKVDYSKLKREFGCDPAIGGGCCRDVTYEIYKGCSVSCKGNFDRFGIDIDSDNILDFGNRTTMSNLILGSEFEKGYFDINEYAHLQELPELQCITQQQIMAKAMQIQEEGFNLEVILSVDEEDDVKLNKLELTELEPFSVVNEGDYVLKILDQNDNSLHERNFSVDFVIFSDPPILTNWSIIFDRFRYQENMKKLEVYHNESLLFSHDIPSFCNNNDVCEGNENYISCPSDCASNAGDGICNRQEGDGCDFDCVEGLDSDCIDLVIENVNLSENIKEGEETQIKVNLSNLGMRNATFEIGLYSNSILETNISVSVSGNFSDVIEFNWTPQEACMKDLTFSLDFTNEINEIDEMNNGLELLNVSVGLKGDTNQDYSIDIFDLAKVGLCYGCSSAQTCWLNCEQADVKPDGIINIFELASVGLNYGKVC